MSKKTRVRIAPSPTGDPHIGTAYTALFNYAFARKNKGDFIVRIEDTDQTRLVQGAEEEIYEALDWLGLKADEGPKQGGDFGPYKQSERLSIYKKHAQELVEKGAAFYCDCSSERLQKVREEQQSRGQVPHYDGKCRENPPTQLTKTVVRLKVPKEGETSFEDLIRGKVTFKNSDIDDQVLLKSDGFPTYHLAAVVDDHLMEITDVIRGEDWLSSTSKHVLLYQAFGWELPVFAHLPLLRNPDKSKLSKRKNPVSVLWYRQQGYLPEALRNFLALMGWSMPDGKEIFGLEEFVEKLDLKRVDPAGPVFDNQKLDWLNGEYIRKISETDLASTLIKGKFTKFSEAQMKLVLPLVKERMKKLSEFDQLVSYFFEDSEIAVDLLVQKGKTKEETKKVLEIFEKPLKQLNSWEKDKIEEAIKNKQKEIDWSNSDLFMTLRLAATGSRATPPLFDTLEALGKEKTLARLGQVVAKLSD
ncbi:MAG: glutamate--tRNA ligase [bacterium]|nr:glutamate--tRNA ligase [bacterium]